MRDEMLNYINGINKMIEEFTKISPQKEKIDTYLAVGAKLLDIKVAINDLIEVEDEEKEAIDMLKAYKEQVENIIKKIK